MNTILLVISRLANLVPEKALLVFGDFLGWLGYTFFPFRRKIIRSNLELAFEGELTSEGIETLVRRNYRHYARTLLEVLQSISWTPEKYRQKVSVEGLQHVKKFLDEGRGGIFLTCHLGNWEFAIQSAAAAGVPIDVVVKQSRNAIAERFLQWYRRRSGAGIFLESGTAKDILRSLSRGRFVAFILDQFMGPPIGLPVTFFGKRAGTAVALALMTERRDIPVVPAYSYRDGAGKIHTVFEPPLQLPKLSDNKEDRLFEKTQLYNDVLERLIRRHPEQWLWLHRRWKAYRGVPRWVGSRSLGGAVSLLFVFSLACSTPGKTPTGIELPPDPQIAVPVFKNAEATPPPHSEPPLPEAVTKADKKKKRAKPVVKKETPKPEAAAPFVLPVEKVPYEIGERIEMDLHWTALPAGSAVLEVREGPAIQGRPTFWLWGNVLSSKLVDAIYHVDNTIESYIDREGLVPYKFLLHMVETAQMKETRVSFDHPKKKAYYWSKRVSQKWGNEEKDRADEMVDRARDMFSALYYARTLEYTLNKKESFPVYENAENVEVGLLPVANEIIHSRLGAFQCWKLKVSIQINNVLKPTGDMYLWLSDDSKKYMVKFDAKLKIGSLYGTLTKIRERL